MGDDRAEAIVFAENEARTDLSKISTEQAINFMKAMAKGQRRFHAALLEWWCRLACADVPLPTSVRATAYL